jgi:hypothetical protein
MTARRTSSQKQSRRSGGDDEESQKSTEGATDDEDNLTPSSKRKNKNGLKPILLSLTLTCVVVFVGSTVALSLVAYNQVEEQPQEEFQLRVSVLKLRISRAIFLTGLTHFLCYIVISV